MKTTLINHALFIATASMLAACAQPETGPYETAGSEAGSEPAAEMAVSGAAVAIEQAERILDRGGDAAEAQALLKDALADPKLTDDEHVAAVVAQSRAHEALEQHDEAIAVVEQELADHAEDRRFPVDRLRKRLRDLLVDETERPNYLATGRKPTPPFARVLGKYFPANEQGHVNVEVFAVGGDQSVREEVGTFNVGDGLRAEMEEECPLCDIHLNVSSSMHGGDWVSIPQSRSHFDDALVVLYYDLEHNRIPARYASLLPMPRAELEQALADGKSLTVARERAGAPPVLLIAAPRTAMLGDVERQVAMLDELPTTPRYLEVANNLRPDEIQAIVRGSWIPGVRTCYETLRQTAPEAEGRVVASFAIAADGSVQRAEVTTEDAPLEVGQFLGCVEDAVTKVSFPAIGRETTIRYPLVLNTK